MFIAQYQVHDIFGLVPLLIAIVMFIAHAFGINPVLHLLTGEIFPTKWTTVTELRIKTKMDRWLKTLKNQKQLIRVRSLGSSLTLCLAMCGSAANSTCYPILQRWRQFDSFPKSLAHFVFRIESRQFKSRSIGFSGVFWFYSGASLAMAVYAYLV